MKYIAWSLAIASLIPGCSGDHMDDDAAEFVALDIERMDVETQRHHDAVMSAEDSSRVAAEAENHAERMQRIMDHMNESMDGFGHCSSGSMGQMRMMMRLANDEMDEHRMAMQPTEPIESLRSHCMAYVTNISEMLDGMRATVGDASCMD